MPRHARKSKLSGLLLRRAKCGAATLAVALLLTAVLTGCGSPSRPSSGSSSGRSPSSEVVAHVGNAAIDRAEVDHWASTIGRSNSIATTLGQTSGTPRARALEFLISSRWILGEAEAQSLSISDAAVQRGLMEKIGALPNGRSEFDEELSSTGQTPADVKREVESAMAAARLRGAVARGVKAVTGTEVASYYAHHRQKFYLPDRRVVYLIELLPTYADAVALGKQLGPGPRFIKRAIRELVRRESPAEAERRENGQLVHMIFAATPGQVAGPAKFNGRWVLAMVKKVIPAGIQPLVVVRGELSKTLAVKRRAQALNRFAEAYARKWTASTSCSPGYVVPGCSEHHGALARQASLLGGG